MQVDKNMHEFQMLLDGMMQKLTKKDGKWPFQHDEDQDLAAAIWRQIALRYRF